jgi:signal transduction histidine kinase
MDGILDEWIVFARTIPAAASLSPKSLRNDAREILSRIAADMETEQSEEMRAAKSQGTKDTQRQGDSAAQSHAGTRLLEGFTLPDMVSEYRALRASVVRQWSAKESPGPESLREMTRFHEGIDQALEESTQRFTDKLDRARELFMGALGHDLRTPLHVIMQCTQYLSRPETPTRTHAQIGGYIAESAEHIRDMVEDLLDVVKTKLGGSLPISTASVDLIHLCHRAVNEIRIAHPSVKFRTNVPNAMFGMWDGARLHQLLLNLLKNAVQHGDASMPITLSVEREREHAMMSVHNEGKPILEHLLPKLFEPLTRGEHIPEHQRGASLGLGLYIAEAITAAHGGRIDVDSAAQRGTTFTVRLPLTGARSSM